MRINMRHDLTGREAPQFFIPDINNDALQSAPQGLFAPKEESPVPRNLTTDEHEDDELRITHEKLKQSNSALQKLKEQLESVNDLVAQLAFISNNDLQEPLRKINIFSTLLSGPKADLNEYAREYSNKINDSAFKMSALVRDLLSFSIHIKRYNREFTQVDLTGVVKLVLEDFKEMIAVKQAVINNFTLLPVYGDLTQLQYLFHHLISNALKFSVTKPKITITSHPATPEDYEKHTVLLKDRRYVSISVQDNGIGFDEKFNPKIFVLFQRLHDMKNGEGSGIGLTICKKIVDDHEGFIFAKGSPNAGATFTVFLPTKTLR